MNPGKDSAGLAQGLPKRLPAPDAKASLGSQRDPAHVAALLQSIANEISQSDQRQGAALADLRARLDEMTERQAPAGGPESPETVAKPALAAKRAPLALPDLRAGPTAPVAPRTELTRSLPAVASRPAAEHASGLDLVYAAVAASYNEATARRNSAVALALPARPAALPALEAEAREDDNAFLDMSALAEPQQAAPARIKLPPQSPAFQASDPAVLIPPPPSRPVVAASLAVERSIDDLARRVAETEVKVDKALQRPDSGQSATAVTAHIDSLRTELEKLADEHEKISVEVGKVSTDVRSLSVAAGRIGPMGDTLEHLNEAIIALRKDMPGFVESAADKTGTHIAASIASTGGNTDLADKLATVQSLLLAQSREHQAADGRSFGALESIRGLVENLHSRIDALEAGEPEIAVPATPAFAATAQFSPIHRQPSVVVEPPVEEQLAEAPVAHLSREDLIASARRAAMAASQRTESLATQRQQSAPTNPRDLVPKAASESLFERFSLRSALGTLAMVALLAMGLGVVVTKYLRKPAPAVTIEQTALPAMPDDLPDPTPKAKAAAPATAVPAAKDVSKPASAPKQPVDPAAGTAVPGKTSLLAPEDEAAPAADASAMPPPAQTKPAAIAEASPVATPASFKSGTLPAAIAPLSTRNAALAGDPAAANIVGERYLSGKGVARNPKLAQHWLEVAANGGSAAAEFRLGVMFEKGDDGLPADRNQATTWYRKSAEHGNVQAMHNLAVLYAGQTEGTPDYATAAKWFEQAANYGLKDSQYNLAVLYQSGLGVTKDAATAYKWFAIGAAHGDTEAAKQRDDLRKTIPAGTLASLEPQIKAWHAKPQPRPSSAADAQSSPATQVLVKPPETAASEVGDVQQMLVKLGYDPGTLDGTMTAQTREAIRTFEQRSGLPDNGEISDELLSKLKGLAG